MFRTIRIDVDICVLEGRYVLQGEFFIVLSGQYIHRGPRVNKEWYKYRMNFQLDFGPITCDCIDLVGYYIHIHFRGATILILKLGFSKIDDALWCRWYTVISLRSAHLREMVLLFYRHDKSYYF